MKRKLVSIVDLTEGYCKLNNINDPEKIKVWKNVFKDYFSIIKEELLKGNIWKPLYNWGAFGIVKRRGGGGINFNETKKAGKLIYYTNEHTNGFHFKLKWGKEHPHIKVGFRNIRMYTLKTSKTFKSQISKEVKRRAYDPNVKDFNVPKQL